MVEIIYVVECTKSRYYVGRCSKKSLIKRLRQHRDSKYPFSKWTKKYPGKTLITHFVAMYPDQLTIETEKWMRVKGIQNVRGGEYNTLKLTPYQIRKIKRKFSWKPSACWRCGRSSHVITNCKEKTYFNGEAFTDDDSDDEKVSYKTAYVYHDKEVDDRPTPGMTWHSIPP